MAKRKAKNTKLPLILMILGSVIIFAVVVWQAAEVLTANESQISDASTPTSDIPFPEIERISVEDAKDAFDAGTATIVDVRDPESFQAGHIAGAINIPYDELTVRLNELDPNKLILTYCT